MKFFLQTRYLAVLICFWGAVTVRAQTPTPVSSGQILTVTTLDDGNDNVCDTHCTLREAIQDASWGTVIKYAATLRGESNLGGRLIIQNKNIEIQGPTDKSLDLTLVGANVASEKIQILSGTQVKIKNITIKAGRIGNYGDLTLDGVTITGSNALATGLVNHGIAHIANSLFYELEIGMINSDSLDIQNSTFYKITDTGMMTTDGTSYVQNSTFAEMSGVGGAIYTRQYFIQGGRLILTNSIVTTSNPHIGACSGTLEDGGGNIQFPRTNCGSTIKSIAPKFADFGDHGGATWTLALQPDSPAIGLGVPSICRQVGNLDQRGKVRLTADDSTCDAGAFEFAR